MPIDVPMRFESERLLWSVADVYTPVECASFIELIERSSPSIATNNPLYRDQDRAIRDELRTCSGACVRISPRGWALSGWWV
jgi:hypothetical protein